MKKIELLSPAGDFDCLKAAVQNGADAVYLGVSEFNARYSAKNFDISNIQDAIDYAHLRNVKVFLTLNTLIKDSEINSALEIVKKVYEYGIDAIIIQDIGLAGLISKNFPDLPLHASTQMTCHNLSGVKKLEKLGFKRIVLAREPSLNEIEYIKSNTKCEIEVFAHGALCISYSGQCLYSSLIGGRSGNRGKCAQGCRLPYSLLENSSTINKGFLLSTKDLSSIEILPDLINTKIDSLKIEGRMKPPEYVATVTRIYRKYINKIYNNEKYIIDNQDKKDLLQVFNRGGFSNGHLSNTPNTELVYKEKQNNMGIYLGNVSKYNSNKGHISLTLNDVIKIGDTISFEHEESKYTVSELMKNNNNIPIGNIDDKVTLGRMKGNIKIGDKIYKLSSKTLLDNAKESYKNENIKKPINTEITIQLNKPITLKIFDDKINVLVESDELPIKAINAPITYEKIEKQLNKLNDTPFYFKNIKINLDDNLFIPHVSTINELRRNAISKYTELLTNSFRRTSNNNVITFTASKNKNTIKKHNICLLLNNIDLANDYSNLENVDKLYIPLKYFANKEYSPIIRYLSISFNTYIYMPTILKSNFNNLFKDSIENAVKKFNIKGFVISNIGNFEFLKEYKDNYEFIGNYTLNIFNNNSIDSINLATATISPELNLNEINELALSTPTATEFIVYGNLPLMTSSYCLLGKSNKCYPSCKQKCKTPNNYYLNDRMNFKFRIISDNLQTISTIYNSKITSIDPTLLTNINNYRIDILDENIDEINNIIDKVKNNKRLEGKEYTNSNLNRNV